jgi:FkbM family methyltransferase
MDLALNANPAFTRWVVDAGLLAEPFVLIDVGVQGGENPRWQPLGDHLVVHGFDPIREVIDLLNEQSQGRPHRRYHWMAVGNIDGEQLFYFNPANPTSSSMYQQGEDRFGVQGSEHARSVPMRRLDSLFAEGLIPKPDFVKVDVEGFEKDVLLGAREYMRGRVLGLQTETNFSISPMYPQSHFSALADLAVQCHLLVFDVAFNRIPRASFQRALVRKGLEAISEQDAVGKPATVDVLFCRDLIGEVDQPQNYQTPCQSVEIDQLIKMIILELHGLNDIALDTAERFAERIGTRLDVDRAIWLLADPDCGPNEYRNRIRAFERSTSWRLTAPLRWLKLGLLAAAQRTRGDAAPRQ